MLKNLTYLYLKVKRQKYKCNTNLARSSCSILSNEFLEVDKEFDGSTWRLNSIALCKSASSFWS